jgi:hypothetical protein
MCLSVERLGHSCGADTVRRHSSSRRAVTALRLRTDHDQVRSGRRVSLALNVGPRTKRSCRLHRYRIQETRRGNRCELSRAPCAAHVIRPLPGDVTFSCKFPLPCPMDWHATCRNTPKLRRRSRCERQETGSNNPVSASAEAPGKAMHEGTGARRSSGTGGIQSNRVPGARLGKIIGCRSGETISRLPLWRKSISGCG